jgi:hypothetical protein
MIKLFRNIHKKLLVKGKTTNYLKYAIAENMHSSLSKKTRI